MSGGPSFLNTIASAFGTFLAFVVEVSIIIIALTTVRPRRPDAVAPLVVGGVLHLFATVTWTGFTTIAGAALAGSSNMLTVYAVVGFFLTLVRTTGWAAILYAIVKLASPATGMQRDPTRYG